MKLLKVLNQQGQQRLGQRRLRLFAPPAEH
jgi:hypothetical protein